jgi:hypothetical protein
MFSLCSSLEETSLLHIEDKTQLFDFRSLFVLVPCLGSCMEGRCLGEREVLETGACDSPIWGPSR